MLASGSCAQSHSLGPLGRLVAYSHAGVEPRIMGSSPVPAVRMVLDRACLKRACLKVDDIDVFEVNEAFAAQALAVIRELGLPPEGTQPERQRHLARAPGGGHGRHPGGQSPGTAVIAVRCADQRRVVHRGPVRDHADSHAASRRRSSASRHSV